MRRLTSLARGSVVPASTLNGVQDEQIGLAPATDLPALMLRGADGRYWTTPDGGIADGELRVVDTSVDWRSRRVWGSAQVLAAANQRPGQGADHIVNDPTSAVATRTFEGWTGTGARGAGGATVVGGTPPVLGDDAFAVVIDERASSVSRVWLFARPADGALCVYNASGAVLHATLLVWGAAVAPTPTALPSDVVPTLTGVLWLAPGTAAARPADPAGPALYYATDTAVWSVWDGAVWRPLGGGGGSAATSTLVPLSTYATVDGPLTVVGRGRFDPAEHAVTGRTTQLTFDAVGDVSRVGVLASVVLRNRTDGTTVATLTFSETDATAKRAVVPLPAGPKVYEVYAQHDGAPTDYLTLGGVGLRITWS